MKEEELKKEHEMKKHTAHFWNLNEDPQLSNMIIHFLNPGKSWFLTVSILTKVVVDVYKKASILDIM